MIQEAQVFSFVLQGMVAESPGPTITCLRHRNFRIEAISYLLCCLPQAPVALVTMCIFETEVIGFFPLGCHLGGKALICLTTPYRLYWEHHTCHG